jgi:hypothetical protein
VNAVDELVKFLVHRGTRVGAFRTGEEEIDRAVKFAAGSRLFTLLVELAARLEVPVGFPDKCLNLSVPDIRVRVAGCQKPRGLRHLRVPRNARRIRRY